MCREPSLDSLTGKNLLCNGTIQPDHTIGKPSCLTLNGYNHHGSETPCVRTTRGEHGRSYLTGRVPLPPLQVCALPLPTVRRPEPTLPTHTHQPSNRDQQGTTGNHPRNQQPTPKTHHHSAAPQT